MSETAYRRGFSLVELLVVVLVLGVLAAVAIPRFRAARDRADDATARANLRTVRAAAAAITAAEQSPAAATPRRWPRRGSPSSTPPPHRARRAP